MLDLLFEYNPKLEARNKNMETPLLVAARRNQLEIVKYLLAKGAKLHANDRCLTKTCALKSVNPIPHQQRKAVK